MASKKKNNITPTDPPKASACMKKLAPAVEKFRSAFKSVQDLGGSATEVERARAESTLCLASRSAYFEFHTWVVLHGEVDPEAKKSLAGLLEESLATMRLPKYRKSVDLRQQDFLRVCERVEDGKSAEVISAVDGGV